LSSQYFLLKLSPTPTILKHIIMRFTSLLFCLPAAAAFAPQAPLSVRVAPSPHLLKSVTTTAEACDEVTSKIDTVLEKADDLVVSRLFRVVNHAPVFVTLGVLAKQLGSAKWGLDIAPGALSISSPTYLAIPSWTGYVLRLIVFLQAASVAKSALANDHDDLSQDNISALAISNVALGRALASGSTVNWALAAIASGYGMRTGKSGGEATISTMAIQLTTAVATVATVMGGAAQLPSLVPFLANQAELTAGIGLAAFYTLATRGGNGKVKKVVNAAVAGGILWGRVAGGALALTMNNLVSVGTVVTAATAYVAYITIDTARTAYFE
jgi:hypothetical protein